jgi:hypothetical protein
MLSVLIFTTCHLPLLSEVQCISSPLHSELVVKNELHCKHVANTSFHGESPRILKQNDKKLLQVVIINCNNRICIHWIPFFNNKRVKKHFFSVSQPSLRVFAMISKTTMGFPSTAKPGFKKPREFLQTTYTCLRLALWSEYRLSLLLTTYQINHMLALVESTKRIYFETKC